MQFWKKDKAPKTEHVEPGMDQNAAPSTQPIKFSDEPMFGSQSIPLSEAQIPGKRGASQGEFVTYPAVFAKHQDTQAAAAAQPQPQPQPSEVPQPASAPAQQPSEPQPQAAEPKKPAAEKKPPLFRRKPELDSNRRQEEADAEFAKKQKWIKARRRFVGALVLLVTAAIAIPLLFDKEPPPANVTIPLRIPKENTVEVSKITIPSAITHDAAEASKAEPQQPQQNAVQPSAKPAVKPEPKKAEVKPAETPKAEVKKPEPPKAEVKKPEAKKPEAQKPEPKKPEAKPEAPKAMPKGQFYIQVVALSNQDKAQQIVNSMKKAGVNAFLSPVSTANGKIWRVQSGPYKTKNAATEASAKLGMAGLSAGKVLQVK